MGAAITAVPTVKAARESTVLTITNGIRKKVIVKSTVQYIRRFIRMVKGTIQDTTKNIPAGIPQRT
jgi:hypothetical protein